MIQSNPNMPQDYENKFADFIEMLKTAKQDGILNDIIASPQVLGETNEEIIESLSRLAEAKLALHITSR